MKPADNLFLLKDGDKLFADLPDAKPVPSIQFKFDIVIHEPGIAEGEPLIEMLQAMIETVTNLIPLFESLLTN